ncbi:MAG: Aspartate ammonia-lyase (EC [uncultured Aureispira sp.]|uniref:Aspartate ammonia-lyase (EC) n=1 Tax=uncultured Aureispira sp. TaxID=1331704 RepID=A0A6S6T6C6_9BACT|nr:MAG: Aspartate ammonia-lyase (EC [uncultured Aureispira sp.]
MKRITILLLLCSFFCSALLAQNEAPTPIKTDIHAVKLHLQGAEVMRKVSVNLKAGRNHLVFTNLSAKLYDQTIQVATSQQAKVISVTSKQNFMERRQATPRIKALNDSLEMLRDAIDLLANERGSYQEEQTLLKQNRSMKSSQQNLTVAELQSMSEFYRKRNFDINKNITRLTKSITALNRQVFDHKLQLYELNADKRAMAEIFLVVEAERAGSTDFDLRYVVSDAGWAAIYDLEASNFANTINLEYRALAYNNTGIDWNKVALTLSTGDPLQSMSQPSLSVWNLGGSSAYQINTIVNTTVDISVNDNAPIQQQVIQEKSYYGVTKEAEIKTIIGADFSEEIDYNTTEFERYRNNQPDAPNIVLETLEVPEFNADFKIEKPYTIPSDRKPYSVDIKRFDLPATYKYYAVPKLDKDAFLLAQVVGWEDLDLVSGPINIYNNKKYIGQSRLSIDNLSDTLAVSLGRDPSVVLSRKKVKGSSQKVFLGTSKKASIAYDIVVRNNHSKAINIEILDQVPISSDKDVIVTIDEKTGAADDAKTGVLSWDLVIEPSQNKSLNFGFSIKYPKDKQVKIEYKKSRKMEQQRYF